MSELKKMIKSKFDYDVSNLSAWTDENELELTTRAVTEARTLGLIDIRTGIKGTQQIPLMDTELIYQDASGCDLSASGDTELNKTNISVVEIGYMQEFCPKTLRGFFAQQALRPGTMAEDKELPFEKAITDYILKKNAAALDDLIWRGDTSISGTSNLNFFDGFATQFDASGDVNEANDLGYAALNSTRIYAALEATYLKAVSTNEAVALSDDFTLWVNRALFTYLQSNYAAKNNFHLDPKNPNEMTTTLFGYNVKVEAIPGLNTHNSIYGARKSSLIFGTDLESDTDSFELWYSQDDDKIYLRSKFSAGVTTPYFDEITKFTLEASS